ESAVEFPPAASPPADKRQAAAADRFAVDEPDDEHGSEIEKALEAHRDRPAEPAAVGAELAELLGLELDVAEFVAENLVAHAPQDRRPRRVLKDGVIDFGDDFGGDQH